MDAASPGDTIRLCPETYAGLTTIDKDLTLRGAGPGKTILDGEGTTQVILVEREIGSVDRIVTLAGLTVTGGNAEQGGAIDNNGDLTLDRVHVTKSRAVAGGAIFIREGRLTLIDSRVTDNVADNICGGICVAAGGDLIVRRSVVSGNEAALHGGGITVGGPSVTIEAGSRVTGNTAGTDGGGIWISSLTTLTIAAGVEVTGNVAASEGGGIFGVSGAEVMIQPGAIVRDNDPDDCGGGATYTGTCPTPPAP